MATYFLSAEGTVEQLPSGATYFSRYLARGGVERAVEESNVFGEDPVNGKPENGSRDTDII
ncbi:MAG: hypothetical protein ACRC9L_08600 [Brevinema sp.]